MTDRGPAWAADDDGDHSAFTHRDDDEPPPYVPTEDALGGGSSSFVDASRTATAGDGLLRTGLAIANLDAIVFRCEKGDKRSDWLPVIAELAREARAALSAPPTPTALDVERLKRAMSRHEDAKVAEHNLDHDCDFGCARDIAAEYQRLSENPDPS